MGALKYFVGIKKRKQEAKNIGGLEIIESQDKELRYVVGDVISCGVDVGGIKVGDVVLFDDRAGHDRDIDGEVIRIVRDTDIVWLL